MNFQQKREKSTPRVSIFCPWYALVQNFLSILTQVFLEPLPTDSHRGTDSVVHTVQVVHLCALRRVVQDRGSKEPEVLSRPRDVHGPCQGESFPCRKWTT